MKFCAVYSASDRKTGTIGLGNVYWGIDKDSITIDDIRGLEEELERKLKDVRVVVLNLIRLE